MQIHITNQIDDTKWRVDNDGFLRITCCILKTDVLEYLKSEVPSEMLTDNNDTNEVINEFIDVNNIDLDVLKSLEGKPVIVGEHEWQNVADNNPVGSIAGAPSIKGGQELLVDVLITDPEVIKQIESKELIEISAGYDAELNAKQGTYNGKDYSLVQVPTNFNHILLLPSGRGRCGQDVRIINTNTNIGKGRINPMGIVVKTQNGKTFQFENEGDASVAEEMANEVKEFNAEQLNDAMTELETLKQQMAELEAKKAELEQLLADAKAQLEQALSPEHQAELAEEAKQQNEDEDAVIAAEVNEGEQEAVKAECQNAKTYAERRTNLVKHVLNSKGVNCDNFTGEAFDGAFEALVATSKAKLASAKQVMGGAKVENSAPSTVNNLDRILRPMSK